MMRKKKMFYEDTKVLLSSVALVAVTIMLQILSAVSLLPPIFFIRIDIVGVPLVLAFFLYKCRNAFLTLAISSVFIAFFAPLGGPFGAFMKFMATGSVIIALAFVAKVNGIKEAEAFRKRSTALLAFILAVFIRGSIMAFLYFYATPLFFSVGQYPMTTESLVNMVAGGFTNLIPLPPLLLAFCAIFVINAIITVLDFWLAWLLAFRFRMAERFGTW